MKAIDMTKIYSNQNYKGNWVAMINYNTRPQVIAYAKTLKETLEQAENKGYKHPVVTQIPRKLTYQSIQLESNGHNLNDRFMYGNVLWYEMCYDESMRFGGAQYKQKGFAPILILVGIVVLAMAAGGAFYLGRQTSPKPSPVATSTTSPSPKDTGPVPNGIGETVNPDPDKIGIDSIGANWKTLASNRCNISIGYPQTWYVNEIDLIPGLDNPKYHFGCIDIKAPDYKSYPQSDVREGLWILITRTSKGAVFKSVAINSVDDYIKAAENIGEPAAKVKNLKPESYGDIDGTYYELSLMETRSSFVFMKGDYLYEISWPTTYSGIYKKQITSILSTFKFLP